MATLALTVTKVTKSGGRVYVRWSDGIEQEFRSLEAAQALRDDLAERKELLRSLAIARYLRVDPNGDTPSLIEGHTITYSDELNSMVVVV